MDAESKPFLGSMQPATGTEPLLSCGAMPTRKSKKDKGSWMLRPIVADNLEEHMEVFFRRKHPEVTNRPLWLAKKSKLGIGTVQRTLACRSGASIDTLEAIAKTLGIQPYKLLMPSAKMRTMLLVDDHSNEEDADAESLHRGRDRSDPK